MGCLVGAVFPGGGSVLAFKNVDVRESVRLPKKPVMVKGRRYKYLKFPTQLNVRKPGLWAGVNEKGVVLLGADAYAIRVFTGRKYGGIRQLMKAYEKALGEASTAKEATELIIREYQDKKIGLDGDIVLVADRREAIAVEYSLNEWGLQFSGPNPYLIRTNFFLVLRHLCHLPQEKGLYLSAVKRYERAMEILSKTNINTTVDALKEVCRDHYPEPSAMSICRHGGKGEYRTVGSVVIELVRNRIKIHYIVGMKPCQGGYQTIQIRW